MIRSAGAMKFLVNVSIVGVLLFSGSLAAPTATDAPPTLDTLPNSGHLETSLHVEMIGRESVEKEPIDLTEDHDLVEEILDTSLLHGVYKRSPNEYRTEKKRTYGPKNKHAKKHANQAEQKSSYHQGYTTSVKDYPQSEISYAVKRYRKPQRVSHQEIKRPKPHSDSGSYEKSYEKIKRRYHRSESESSEKSYEKIKRKYHRSESESDERGHCIMRRKHLGKHGDNEYSGHARGYGRRHGYGYNKKTKMHRPNYPQRAPSYSRPKYLPQTKYSPNKSRPSKVYTEPSEEEKPTFKEASYNEESEYHHESPKKYGKKERKYHRESGETHAKNKEEYEEDVLGYGGTEPKSGEYETSYNSDDETDEKKMHDYMSGRASDVEDSSGQTQVPRVEEPSQSAGGAPSSIPLKAKEVNRGEGKGTQEQQRDNAGTDERQVHHPDAEGTIPEEKDLAETGQE